METTTTSFVDNSDRTSSTTPTENSNRSSHQEDNNGSAEADIAVLEQSLHYTSEQVRSRMGRMSIPGFEDTTAYQLLISADLEYDNDTRKPE